MFLQEVRGYTQWTPTYCRSWTQSSGVKVQSSIRALHSAAPWWCGSVGRQWDCTTVSSPSLEPTESNTGHLPPRTAFRTQHMLRGRGSEGSDNNKWCSAKRFKALRNNTPWKQMGYSEDSIADFVSFSTTFLRLNQTKLDLCFRMQLVVKGIVTRCSNYA